MPHNTSSIQTLLEKGCYRKNHLFQIQSVTTTFERPAIKFTRVPPYPIYFVIFYNIMTS